MSRGAFVLAKFLALGSGMVATAVAVQGAGAYAIAAVADGPAPVVPFVAALVALAVHVLFYLALALMLGTVFQSRNPVIAIPLLLLFVMAQWLGSFELSAVAGALLAEGTVPTAALVAIAAYALLTVALLGVATWRFGREEF